jgi:outer membrane protein W
VRAYSVVLSAVLTLGFTAQANAQPLVRADFTGIIAWLNVNKSGLTEYNDWYNRSAYGGAAAGWFWTDHLRTEVDIGASSPAELYAARPIDLDGVRTYTYSEYRFSTRRIALSQQYQFLRNVWVHPHVGVGLDVTWERTERTDEPVFTFDSVTRATKIARPEFTAEPTTQVLYRPFAEIGFKAYMSRTVFFRADMRTVFHSGLDELLLRFGVGVDVGTRSSSSRH